MAINPLLQNLIDNTKPVQTTKYKANSSEDYKAQSVSSNFQIYGNSPMKPAPIKFTPMPLKKPTVEGMINDFNKNIPIQPMSGQGTIAPAPAPSMTQPLPGIQQLPSEVKTSGQEFAEGFSANLQNRQANDFVPVTQQTVLDLSANIAQGDTIEAIKSKFPELQHLDDQVIKDFSANLAQGDNYETLVQKYPELNPDIANNPDQRGFSLKQEGKNFLNYASAFGDTVSQLGTKAIDEGIMQKGTYGKIVSGDIEGALESTVPNTLGGFAKFVIQTPAFITTIAEDPEGTVSAMGEQGKELVKMAVEDPRGTAKKLLEYGLDNPVDIIFALQGAKSLLKQGEKIAQQGQKLYNTAKVIAENQEVPVKFNRVNPGAITTPEMAQKFSQPVKETVRTTMPAREVIKVKAKQGFENLKRKAQEVLPKKGVQETVIDAGATDYSTKAQEVVQKAKDVFKKKPTAEVVTDTPETTGKSTLDKVQPSKKDVVQGERKGIDPIVVAVVKAKPGLFKQVQNGEITEETVADKIIQAKEQKFSESSQIGKTYESMYQSEYKFDGNTILDQSVEKLKSLGISLEDGVKIDSTKYVAESGEKGKIGEALSKIFDIQGKEISVQELHTLRKSVDKLIKRSEGIDRKNSKAVLELRSIIDNELKDKIGGWKGLDEMSSQKYDEIGQIMSEFFDRKGKFKYDPKTLLTDRNKKKLDILEELIPGVKDEIIMLATHKSYLRSKNTNKPGTYRKSMIKQVASTLGGIAGVTAGNSTVGSILMGMAGTYVGEKVGAYFGDPESFIKSITKDNRGASIIDDIEIGQDISQADKEYLNSLVKEAIKSGKIQKTERIMKKNKEEAIKKEVKRGLDTLIRKKSMSLPEKTETNLGTKRNPIRAYDKRPKEEIKAQENKKQDFQKNYKVASLDNFTIDRAKRGELYFGDGTKVSTIKNKPAYPYNPIQAILEDGRTIDLMKQGNDLFVKKTVGLDNLKPKEKQIQTVIETPEKEGLMPRDEGYQSTVKEGVNTINLSEMTDDEFMNYQEKLDVDNISPDIEKAISDEIFRRSNIDIPQGKFIDSMMKEISIIDSMEQRVGTVGSSKVTDKKYKDEQQKAVDKRRERAIETIQEELGIDQNEAYDKYLELQNKYKYQQVIRDRSNIEPSEALATIRKYFDEDELSVNFLDNIVTPSGQEAFGRYYNKTIDMIKNPHKTTADHESAHAYFDMFTSKEDQSKILGQIKKEQGFTDDLEAEEFLADGFADYVSGKAKMTYGQKIKEFFKNVWEQIKKLFGKEDQVKQFYNDIMNKRRKTLGKKTQLKFKDTKFETYGEADKYTIQPIIDIRKEIKADIIKKDTLQKMINRQSYRGPERKALEEIVSNMKGDTIPKEEVINGLKASIMPLNTSYTHKYAGYNKLYSVSDSEDRAYKHTASTIILEAPFTTDVTNHFNDPNYFSHVRVSNENGDYENRVLMELQSDLMQHEEKYSNVKDVRKRFSNDDILKAVKDLIPQSKIDEFFNIAMDSAEINPGEYRKQINIMNINKAIKNVSDGNQELIDDIIKNVNKNLSLGGNTPIGNYKNEAWMRRTIDETIKHLSDEGAKTLKVPYGITVAMIEGHYRPVGNIEQSDVQRVIYIALGNDNIRNLAEDFVSERYDERDELSQEEKFDMIDRGVKSFLETQGVSVEQRTITDPAMFGDLLDMLEDSIEPTLMNRLKISGKGEVKIGEDHSEKIASMPKQFQTVANFYEKQLMKYVKKQYPGGKDVEYEGGIWHEIDISQYGDKPLRVYQTKDSVRKRKWYEFYDLTEAEAVAREKPIAQKHNVSIDTVQFLANHFDRGESYGNVTDKVVKDLKKTVPKNPIILYRGTRSRSNGVTYKEGQKTISTTKDLSTAKDYSRYLEEEGSEVRYAKVNPENILFDTTKEMGLSRDSANLTRVGIDNDKEVIVYADGIERKKAPYKYSQGYREVDEEQLDKKTSELIKDQNINISEEEKKARKKVNIIMNIIKDIGDTNETKRAKNMLVDELKNTEKNQEREEFSQTIEDLLYRLQTTYGDKPLRVYQTKNSVKDANDLSDINNMFDSAFGNLENTRFTEGQILAGIQEFLLRKYPDHEKYIFNKISDIILERGIYERIEKTSEDDPNVIRIREQTKKWRENAKGSDNAEKLLDLTITDDMVLSHPHFESYNKIGANISNKDIKEYYDKFFKRISKSNDRIKFSDFETDLDNSLRRGYISQRDINLYNEVVKLKNKKGLGGLQRKNLAK